MTDIHMADIHMAERARAYEAAGVEQGLGDKLLDDLEAVAADHFAQYAENYRRAGTVLYAPHGIEATAEHTWNVSLAQGLAILAHTYLQKAAASAPERIGGQKIHDALADRMMARILIGPGHAPPQPEEPLDVEKALMRENHPRFP